MIEFAIVMTTYRREDGKTPFLIRRALESVKSQTYQNFKMFVIGDKYDDDQEFQNLFSEFPFEKLYFENLSIAHERDKYTNKELIWNYGGCFANNFGIEKALSDGYEYICHLDHDDWWYNNHLELINKCIQETGCDWACTKSTFKNNTTYLPNSLSSEIYLDFLPRACRLIHSSVCMNFKKIKLRHRNVYEETGKIGLPGDADLWERTREYLINNNLKSIFINKLSCRHDEEGYEYKN